MAYMLRPVIQDDNMSEHVRTKDCKYNRDLSVSCCSHADILGVGITVQGLQRSRATKGILQHQPRIQASQQQWPSHS